MSDILYFIVCKKLQENIENEGFNKDITRLISIVSKPISIVVVDVAIDVVV